MTQSRIFKNTILLYVRMLFSVCINLYASRVILQVLGVDDFGVFNLVGGIVAVISFLNTSMAGSTSRFLTYELGRNDKLQLHKTFAAARRAHFYLALIVAVIGETIGLWFANSQLAIPSDRVVAANFVYQFALFVSIVSFVQVPYKADVISHERMDIYAYIEILYVLLKLAAIYLISCFEYDSLIVYSFLLAVIAVIVYAAYAVYCRKNFDETVRMKDVERDIMMPMLKFSGWDLYGNGCVVIQQQGVNVLINRFFGISLNAASGVATQASSAVSMFVSNLTTALRPPLIKKYASGDIEGMQNLLVISIILCTSLAELISLPLFLRLSALMELWLVYVPKYSIQFCEWMILTNAVMVINTLFTAVIHATGNIKRLSLISGTIYLLTVVFTFFAFKLGAGPVATYFILFVVTSAALICNVIITKKQIPTISLMKLFKGILLPMLCIAIAITVTSLFDKIISNDIWGFIILFFINAVVLLLSLYLFWALPKFGWNVVKYMKDEI